MSLVFSSSCRFSPLDRVTVQAHSESPAGPGLVIEIVEAGRCARVCLDPQTAKDLAWALAPLYLQGLLQSRKLTRREPLPYDPIALGC